RVILCSLDRVTSTVMRRLQLAVERSGASVFLLRPSSALQQPSWADLRFRIQSLVGTNHNPDGNQAASGAQHLAVELLKARSAVTQTGRAELKVDYETGVVSEISQLANPASPTSPAD
ncbi:MAG: hypothetical protein KDA96_24045, partial [Planctomycetaceae bacterium]|nr:hypothetical protein [Planctomycetaceae bacterium]